MTNCIVAKLKAVHAVVVMSYSKKIASATVQNRSQTPFFSWLRSKLLAVNRTNATPPPGIAGPNGECVYNNPSRFPNTQTARTLDPPALPGGVHHKLSANYYLGRDGRRTVLPPAPLYAAGTQGVQFGTAEGQEISQADAVSKGPDANFGLEAPTPGFGAQWARSKHNELQTQQNDPELAYLEKFDRYATNSR